VLQPGRSRWAPSACLLSLALLAAMAAASPTDTGNNVAGQAEPYEGEAQALAKDAQRTLDDVSWVVGSTVTGVEPATVLHPALAHEDDGEGGSASGNGGGSSATPGPEPGPPAPFQGLPQQLTDAADNTLLPYVPKDPIGLATGAAEDASRIPQDLLASTQPKEGTEPATTPKSNAAQPVASSVLTPTLILAAAGATAAVTFFGFWLAGSSGAVGAKAAAGAGSRVGDLRRLLPFASPLFTRFERDTVLGHPRREALYALILQEPGISLQALGDATGLSRTAVIHHLRLIEQQHLIVSRRVGRSRHYFENGGRYGHDQKEAYAILQNGRSKAVAEFIKGHPGAMQKALCEALGIQPSIAHWHVRRLEEAKIVETIRQGRTVAYYPGPGLTAMDATAAATAQQAPAATA